MLNQKITQSLSKSAIFLMIFSLVLAGLPVLAEASVEPSQDSLIKAHGRPAVYYYASDGKRYVFPNEKIYKSWFTDFSDVTEVDMQTLSEIPLGGNVHYRPGVVMVKIVSVPTVYVVSANGVLRSVGSEAMAQLLYGENWNLLIDDLPDSFFTDYQIGPVIESEDDYDPEEEVEDTPTINHNRRLKFTKWTRWSNTYKCRAIPAIPAIPAHKSPTGIKIPAVPAIPARYCVHEYKKADKVAPTISDISVEVTNTTATISWTTDEESTSKVKYATETLGSSSDIKVVSDSSLVTSHELSLTNLDPGTTYYFILKSTDASGNTGVSVEQTFTTTGATPGDTTPPVISGIGVVATTTSAVVSWTTDENSTSKVKYADKSLATATSTIIVSNSALVSSHSLELISLMPNTTYYFMVESTDGSNNTATSTEQTFTTAEEPVEDNTPPVISSIAVVPSTTSAVITWTTDEDSTSKVEYADESLTTATSTSLVSDSALVTSHELELLGLTASTTYYFMIESKDASDNTATSTEQMFDTL